jgi:hypothetical protein
MRLLKFNGQKVDIDEQTAIGIDVQAFDIRTPSATKINVSNNFTIPKTVNNLKLVGFAGQAYEMNNAVYEPIYVNYWIDNEHLIKDGKLKVEVSNRIECFIYSKSDIWDDLKKYAYADFVADLIEWLDIPKLGTESNVSFQDFLIPYTENTEGISLPLTMGNLFNQLANETEYFEDKTKIWVNALVNVESSLRESNGGHFFIYAKTIFDFLADKYNVDFHTDGGGVTGNVFDDEYILRMLTPLKNLTIRLNANGYYFINDIDSTYLTPSIFAPEKDLKYCDGKSVFDIVDGFFKHFNIIKTEKDDNIYLRRFDGILDFGRIVNFSSNLSGEPTFKPTVEGLAQQNLITFKNIFPTGAPTFNSKTILCNNTNIDAKVTILEIDCYVPSLIEGVGGNIINLSNKEAFKVPTWLIRDEFQNSNYTDIFFNAIGTGQQSASLRLFGLSIYSLANEYNLYAAIVARPKYFEVKKWLSLADIIDFDFFNQYYIKELGASFLVNKIKGFNPDKSKEPTTLELILSSYAAPIMLKDIDYYIDGLGEMFIDVEGDFFI